MTLQPEIQLGKYIIAGLSESKPKTAVYDIISVHHRNKIGEVRWYSPWRQYVFEPEPLTVWNRDCLQDISVFLQKLMDARKKEAGS
jgi:hypothetical protein